MFIERYIIKEGLTKKLPIASIKKGDVFKLFEPTGEEVIDKKNDISVFTASKDAYINSDGIWQFDYQLNVSTLSK